MKNLLLGFFLLFLSACGERGEVYVQDKKILDTPIECMSLSIFPPNEKFEQTLSSLYKFSPECSYQLILSYKTDIVCNSNQNYAQKTSGLPSGYLRLEIKKDGVLQYTYYKDLKSKLDDDEIMKGFEQIEHDLKL